MASYAAADRIGHALPQPTPELLHGFDTATQITALAHWLRHQPSPRIALGSQGIRVGPADLPTPSSAERRKLLRDGLRLALWRAAGSTGAWLAPQVVARKRADCWDVGVVQRSARALRNSTDSLTVCLYYRVLRIWAGYGGFGI